MNLRFLEHVDCWLRSTHYQRDVGWLVLGVIENSVTVHGTFMGFVDLWLLLVSEKFHNIVDDLFLMLLIFQNFSNLSSFVHFVFASADGCSLSAILRRTWDNEHLLEARVGVASCTAYGMRFELGCFLEVEKFLSPRIRWVVSTWGNQTREIAAYLFLGRRYLEFRPMLNRHFLLAFMHLHILNSLFMTPRPVIFSSRTP